MKVLQVNAFDGFRWVPLSHLDVDVQLLGDGHQIGADLLQGADVAGSQGDPDAVHRRSLSLGLLEVLGHLGGGRSRSNSGSLKWIVDRGVRC